MDKILTIIIPTYNMEKYLEYCLDSLLIGKACFNLLEVLIINDGSRDTSSAIAHRYAENFPDVFRVIDKENGNYGSCINRGLKEATGKYVKVLDADDSFDTANFEGFVPYLAETDADLILSDFVVVDEDRNETHRVSYNFGKSFLPMNRICVKERFKDMEMHAVTYRRKMLLDIGYKQTEGISYTDQQWIFAPMAAVQTVGIFNKPVYKYLVGRAGQTIDPVVKAGKMTDRTKYVLDMLRLYDALYQCVAPEIKEYLDARIRPNVQDIYITYFSCQSKISKSLIGGFDDDFRKVALPFYNQLASLNLYIKIWRMIKNHAMLEKLFCICFTALLRVKILIER